MIVLTSEQSDKVRGLSPIKVGHGLNPIELPDGSFMLNENVLDDPAHTDVKDFLSKLPRADLSTLTRYSEDNPPPTEKIAAIESKARLTTRTVIKE